ncbi:MAG: serine hydrolase [Solirubrobacterales bacterium]
MSYPDPYRRPPEPFWPEQQGTPGWAKVVAVVIVIAGIIAAGTIYVSRESEDSASTASIPKARVARTATPKVSPIEHKHPADQEGNHSLPPATAGTSTSGSSSALPPQAEASFRAMSASLSAQVGLAVQTLGGGTAQEFGDLREGHAWSSIKVPILATLLREQSEALSPEEEVWARSAITASDNEAAASLFGRIEETQGGLVGASRAVEAVLHEAGSTSTVVATSPPPPGAVSTYGQTEWSLAGAAQFFAALGRCEILGPQGTGYVESLMEEVIPEQRWGLGEAGFPADWRVAMKGGWGPEAEAGGSYLVRQSGIIESEEGGIAVAMIAIDDSGSYGAGASDLTAVAQWLAGELNGLGPVFQRCAG